MPKAKKPIKKKATAKKRVPEKFKEWKSREAPRPEPPDLISLRGWYLVWLKPLRDFRQTVPSLKWLENGLVYPCSPKHLKGDHYFQPYSVTHYERFEPLGIEVEEK